MTKYVVGKKCEAIEWVFVEADNVVQARLKAGANEDVSMASNRLEFNKYLSSKTFIVKELTPDEGDTHSPIRGRVYPQTHNAEGEVILDDE